MIFKYTFRSLFAQRSSSLLALAVLCATSTIVIVLWGLTAGLVASVSEAGDPRTATIVQNGEVQESSTITHGQVEALRVLPQLARDGGPTISSEVYTVMPFVQKGALSEVRLRGVDSSALAVHPEVTIDGRLPTSAEEAVVVGARLAGTREGWSLGGTIVLSHRKWTVVGVLHAKDSGFESEVWADRAALKHALGRVDDSSVYLRLAAADGQPGVASAVAGMRGENLKAYSERAYNQEQLKGISIYFDAIYIILGILFISMVLISANTLYTSFLARTRELATLLAIGFTRRRVMLMMTLESLLLTSCGAILAVGVAMLANGYRFSIEEMSLSYSVKITTRVLTFGVGVSLVTGLIASLVANVQIARINVLTSLRD